MIARLWRGRTRARDGAAYAAYLQRTGVAECHATSGNLGVLLLRRSDGDEAEFLFISLWDDFNAVARFAGGELERAVYFPEDEQFLLEREPRVRHFDVLVDPFRAEVEKPERSDGGPGDASGGQTP